MAKKKQTGRGGARPGAGRPTVDGAKTASLGVRFSPDIRDFIDLKAAEWSVTPSEAVRRLVEIAVATKPV